MNDYIKTAELLFPHIDKTPQFYLDKYPKRDLTKEQLVTRFAPSPTGYVHLGSLYTSYINYKLAKDSNGVFFLRIEDTDLERQIENGVEGIVKDLNSFEIIPTEGVYIDENNNIYQQGEYGPYIQTERQEIYQTFIKDLIMRGKAYPCFCSKEEVDEVRDFQMNNKSDYIGYYGKYAKCRNLTHDQIKANIDSGKSYVIRLKSPGKEGNRIVFNDILRGDINILDNVIDVVLLKSGSALPPYNLAHAVDDTLMGTSIVARSNEWLSSTPEHIQIFEAIGSTAPKYCHIAFVQRFDPETGFKRKLSKRKDPETAVATLMEMGYPKDSVYEYLMTLANTNYEEWKMENPDKTVDDYTFQLDKMSLNGPLYDQQKFDDVSKNIIATFSPEKLYDLVLKWAKTYNTRIYKNLLENKEFSLKMFEIDRIGEKPKKDITCFADVEKNYSFLFNDYFKDMQAQDYEVEGELPANLKEIFDSSLENFDEHDEKQVWFEKIKQLSEKFNYASNVKDYRKNPENYNGSVVHITNFLRVALTGKQKSMDLFSMMVLLGKEEVGNRLSKFVEIFNLK